MPTDDTHVATMNSFSEVDPTGGSCRRWQDFSSTQTLLLKWRPRHGRLSALGPSHNKTEAKGMQQQSHCRHPTSSRQTGRGNSSSRDREPGEDEQEGNHDQTGLTALKNEQVTTEMQSQYQKDFPPPSSFRRRRTPALPQQDNIGINPAFRIEFGTVQRETYPGWPVVNCRYAGRLRPASPGQPNTFQR
ncbi:uncharacterized protein si:dkeyp-69c1.9 isoform X2 [Seriola aureovittata]|uniref:uncharacterized protein si:dkeyp-69c1.9 isoform X2 n=1 Tax=Seriola aureovittata TaxID=2871759 RepID=UPI0024BDD3B1|nr:uncharacterized protein si:dkeyp-69c1.9 isoform X2 [Seriola aureovittata]